MMKRSIRRFVVTVSGFAAAAGILLAVATAWFVWELHPWVASGRAFDLGHWQFEDCEFQVWQRKNPEVFEPFADGLFVRRATNQWQVFCFDIQDSYSPRVELRRQGTQVLVYRGGKKRGVYDLATHTFRRHEQPLDAVYIALQPPGDWWLQK